MQSIEQIRRWLRSAPFHWVDVRNHASQIVESRHEKNLLLEHTIERNFLLNTVGPIDEVRAARHLEAIFREVHLGGRTFDTSRRGRVVAQIIPPKVPWSESNA